MPKISYRTPKQQRAKMQSFYTSKLPLPLCNTTSRVFPHLILHLFAEGRNYFTEAESLYRHALRLITKTKDPYASIALILECEVSTFWEPVYNNLAHTLRRLEKFEEALFVYKKSVLLSKSKADAMGSMGICYASLGA